MFVRDDIQLDGMYIHNGYPSLKWVTVGIFWYYYYYGSTTDLTEYI